MYMFSGCFLLVSAIALNLYFQWLKECHWAWYKSDDYIYCFLLVALAIYCFMIDFRQRTKK